MRRFGYGGDHPHLQELDINPLMATPAGCIAVDARIVWGNEIAPR